MKNLETSTKTFLSLLLISTAFASCTDETESFVPKGTPLQLSVKTASIETRGLIESATLPDGDAHSIGLTLVDDGEATYDGRTYNNIKATPSTSDGKQSWAMASDIYLSSTTGTLYSYYPYSSSVTSIEQIPVTAEDTDYMYATPVNNLDDGKYTASVTMNHALAAIRLKVVRGTYTGTGAVTAVSVKGDNIATSGKLNAKTGVLSGQSGAGTAITYSTAFTLSTTAKQIDQIIVPVTSSSAAPTFTATIDGKDYTATPAAVTLTQGIIYEYTLTVNAKEISLSDVKVGDWGYNSSGNPVINAGYNITLAGNIEGIAFSNNVNDDGSVTIKAVPNNPNGCYVKQATYTSDATITQSVNTDNGILTINISNISSDITLNFDNVSNVYAISSTGALIDVTNADESCIAVALVVEDAPTPQRIMIEKNGDNNTVSVNAAVQADEASNTEYQKFYWGPYGTDVSGITNWTGGDDKHIPTDYTTWLTNSTYAWNDFNGKSNTAALLNVTDSDSYTTYANAATYCKKFNETVSENQGYTDWYIPACGQLALMYLNMTAINDALTKIGGTTFSTYRYYWSSSEYGSNSGWYVNFSLGNIGRYGKGNSYWVRFVRDF